MVFCSVSVFVVDKIFSDYFAASTIAKTTKLKCVVCWCVTFSFEPPIFFAFLCFSLLFFLLVFPIYFFSWTANRISSNENCSFRFERRLKIAENRSFATNAIISRSLATAKFVRIYGFLPHFCCSAIVSLSRQSDFYCKRRNQIVNVQ